MTSQRTTLGDQLELFISEEQDAFANVGIEVDLNSEDQSDSTWSASVALDPKHRPQERSRPSSTVRRAWCRSPQEAHLLERERGRYRRLSPDEIAILQGFDPCWFSGADLTDWNKVAAIGDAVPPPLARGLVWALRSVAELETHTSLEICAGAGGLASGAAAAGLEHIALVEKWGPACDILRSHWTSDRVLETDLRSLDLSPYIGGVGLLSGGPPCQPWSQAGEGRGFEDERDLLGTIHEVVGEIAPEAILFENVPGLGSDSNRAYLDAVIERLRRPGTGLTYGVAAGVLNAADFGVPQRRRRLFIVGLRDKPNVFAHRIFDVMRSSASHRSPRSPDDGRLRWLTVGEALEGVPDPGGWRHWRYA